MARPPAEAIENIYSAALAIRAACRLLDRAAWQGTDIAECLGAIPGQPELELVADRLDALAQFMETAPIMEKKALCA